MGAWGEILIAMIIAVLLLLVEHWGPWERLVGLRFHRIANYVLGVLAINLPLTWLLAQWQLLMAVAGLWAITVAGGLAVVLSYVIDGWVETRTELRATKAESTVLRERITDDTRQKARGY